MTKEKLSAKETILVLLVVIIMFSTGSFVGWYYGFHGVTNISQVFTRKSDPATTLFRGYRFIEENYDGQVAPKTLVDNSLRALVDSLGDPYSFYVSKEEYERLKEEDIGKAVGIGVIFVFTDHVPTILEVFPGSPADKAGIQQGDVIVSIEGEDTQKMENEVALRNRIKGAAGETSTFTIRNTKGEPKEVTVTRAAFTIPTFSYKTLEPKVGYLKVYHFSPTLQDDFAGVEKAIKEEQLDKLIIDLRNNLGGDTLASISFANTFMTKGIIVKEKFHGSVKEEISEADGKGPFGTLPIVVLVNSDTASAAEIVTAALQQNDRAKVVGEKTFGKGVSGTFFELGDGSAMDLTIAKWFTPHGDWVGGKGITPDIETEDDRTKGDDPILKKALTL